jgi:type II secretory pathway component GspD/PulD (secretin)
MKKNIFAFCIAAVAFVVADMAFAQDATPARSLRSLRSNGLRPAAVANTAPGAAQPAQASDSADETADPKEAPALNWDATPVDIVFQTYGEQVGKTILKDPAVPNATITLKSREGQKLTKEEYLEAIEVVLEMNGIHLEPYGEKFIRAVPRGKARKEGIPLYMDIADVPVEAKDGRVISVMISFKSIATDEAQKALENFKSDTGILNVFERTNSILVTDTWQNIKRMEEIARSIDISSPVLEQVFVYQVENASANDIKSALEQIVQESQKELEKNGKSVQNTTGGYNPQSNISRPTSLGAGRLLNRPGQPEQPKPLESTVTSMSDADRGMIRGKVLILADERSNKLVIITSKSNYDFFEKVIKQLDVETTPDTVVKVYRLKYAEADEVADMINDLIGNAPSSKSSTKSNQNAAAKGQGGTTRVSTPTGANAANATRKSANQRSGEAKPGELSKENTTVLADKRINGLVVMTNKELVPVVESIIEAMDVKLSQVLIETVIIEVTLGDELQTGVDWVMRGRGHRTDQVQRKNALGQPLYYTQRTAKTADGTATSTSILADVVPEGFSRTYKSADDTITYTDEASKYGVFDSVTSLVRDGFVNNGNFGLGGGGGSTSASALLSTVMNVSTNATSAYFGGATPIGSGINYILKSDKLNLAAIIQASKTDNHAKYIASPIVMTVDNKEATIEATETRKFYSGSTSTSGYGSSNPTVTYNYTDKDIGIKIKVTPKINPNGTVMLEIEEEYSQLGAGQTVLVSGSNGGTGKENIDTALTRKMSADILLENMQTVVLGGLTETFTQEEETGIPILKDLPWIGKWLFGTVSQAENRKELLVFMTPYVLEEGEAAQAEALRRKRALSDTRPWDDHGWSASPIADPVSRKEQMRKLKDEWKNQDEERKTKLAIEDEKVKRARALEQMGKEERKHWLEMHKDELDEADRDEELKELKEKMKSRDDETQEELRKLAADIRAKKLKAAETEIKAADEAAQADNEYQKLKAKKKAGEPENASPKEPAADEVK